MCLGGFRILPEINIHISSNLNSLPKSTHKLRDLIPLVVLQPYQTLVPVRKSIIPLSITTYHSPSPRLPFTNHASLLPCPPNHSNRTPAELRLNKPLQPHHQNPPLTDHSSSTALPAQNPTPSSKPCASATIQDNKF
ncbi:hypothetical protein OCU04_007851 [Sclerotinia nivalis]|uniref:Uncharacterized protein n=1 Tax=Sclerotinia nivalis TaxID=352851 RepID=A0A9X0DKE6_9HELO|nr:hypothetical protein OCU04_007851 [Sclerotinia nivalis]